MIFVLWFLLIKKKKRPVKGKPKSVAFFFFSPHSYNINLWEEEGSRDISWYAFKVPALLCNQSHDAFREMLRAWTTKNIRKLGARHKLSLWHFKRGVLHRVLSQSGACSLRGAPVWHLNKLQSRYCLLSMTFHINKCILILSKSIWSFYIWKLQVLWLPVKNNTVHET